MKKYVIVSATEILALELKVETYIDQGYEPCGGLVVASGRNIVFSQAMWLIPTINVMTDGFMNRETIVKEINATLTRIEEDKLKDGS